MGFIPVHNTRVTAQVETHKRGGYRLVVGEGMDLAHTGRYKSVEEAMEGAANYVRAAHSDLERSSLRQPQPAG
jgi:hypothetical protein